MPLTSLLALYALACPTTPPAPAPLAGPAPAQEDVAEATARLRAYLARNPFHGRVFDDLVSTARTLGGLEELERLLRSELEAAEDDASARSKRILLARLAARAERLDDALELLEPLEASSEDDALELRLLRGRLLLEAGRVAPARELLRRAASDFEGEDAPLRARDLQEELLRLLLDVEETSGDRDGVVAALERLRGVLGRDHAGRLELASLFDRYELLDRAEELLAAAADDAADDAARSCDALAALGRLRERAGRGEEALEAYDAALARLAPGHWLRAELLERAIRLRLLGGTLEPWLAATREEAASGDLGPGLDLARALEISGRQEAAAETLAALRAQHPAHEDLGTRLVRAARAAGRLDLAADELQRRTSARPGDPLAQLELATALDDLGAADGAKRALERALELADTSEDMGVAVRVGRAAFARDDHEFARTAFERAAELRPDEAAPLLEFARAEREADRVEGLMARAADRADGEELLEVARAWDDLERPDDAARTLRAALDDPLARPQALAALATRVDEAGDSAAAAELWLTLANESVGSRRNDALDRYVSCHDGGDAKRAALETWTERAKAAPSEEGESLVAWGIVARLRSALNDPLRSSMAWREVVELAPDDVTARRALAAQLGFARRFDEALVELAHLIELDAAQRPLHLLERARLYGEAGRTESALADLARVAVESRTNPDLLRRAAARCQALGYPERARPLYERVLRLDPEDGRTARTLARLEQEAGDRARARELLLVAWQNTDQGAERETILRDLQESLRRGPEREEFLDGVVARVLASRYDRDALDLALELLPWARRFEDLERVADTLLERAPEALAGLHARSQARTAQGDTEGAVADVSALVARGEDIDEVLTGLSEALRASEALDADTARAFGALSGDAEGQARLLLDAGCKALAAAYVAGDVDARGLPNDGRLDLIYDLRVYVEPGLAIQGLAALNDRDGATVVRTHALGLLHFRNGDPDGAVAMGEQLFAIGAHPGMIEAYFDTIEAPETYQKLLAERGEK